MQETVTDPSTGEIQKRVVYTIGHDVISQSTFTYSSGTVQSEQTLVLHADGHGSTRVLTDLAAAIVEVAGVQQLFHYSAYGVMLGVLATEAATTLLYNGEQFDANIGKQYLRARYYDPATGTFNRLDPFAGNLQDPQSLHKYLYTHANPINGIDPTGRYSFGLGLGISIGAVAANVALEVYQGIRHDLDAWSIAANVGRNLAFFGLIAVAIVGSGPIAVAASAAVLTLGVIGIVQLLQSWPQMDGVDKTVAITQLLTYSAFGIGIKATGYSTGGARLSETTGARRPPLETKQTGKLNRSKVTQYRQLMENELAQRPGTEWFDYSRSAKTSALLVETTTGRIAVNAGNHRFAAALEILRDTGEATPLIRLLETSHREPVPQLKSYGDTFPFPYVEGAYPASRFPPVPLPPPGYDD